MSWVVGVTLGIALVGAVLGVLNTWDKLSKNRVRLRVVPKLAIFTGGDTWITGDRNSELANRLLARGALRRLCVTIVNLSAFPVTISDVGFGRVENHRRHSLVAPEISPSRKEWPPRLEPRESIVAYGPVDDFSLDAEIVSDAVAYAKTDCGKIAYGKSAIFTDLVNALTQESEDVG